MKYKVYISLDNNFIVEASTRTEAERQIHEMDPYSLFKDGDFVITEVEFPEEAVLDSQSWDYDFSIQFDEEDPLNGC